MEIRGLSFGIMGMARSGIAAALKILDNEGRVFISDIKTKEESRKEIVSRYGDNTWQKLAPFCEFEKHTDKLLESDMLIVSPGISIANAIIQKAIRRNIKTVSEIEFGYLIKEPNSKIIAVTGSNGKSTTVSLIHHILQNAGYKSILAGNIGNPMTAFPIEKPGIEYLVLELSSFQLELIDNFRADIAILLNISADHLDRHSSMENYLKAKMNIFRNQDRNHKAVLNADDHIIMSEADNINSQKVYFSSDKESLPPSVVESIHLSNEILVWQKRDFTEIKIDTSNTHLLGVHNRMNIMSAILAVSEEILDLDILKTSLSSFLPLPHRLEKVAEIGGIEFINDSKATNTDSVKYALTAFRKPIHLIAGGYEKGEDYAVLLPYLKNHVKRIYLIGNARTKMQLTFQSLKDRISTHMTMMDAVHTAFNQALKGEVILLSPACASFDMYKNYEHRGDVFRTIVKELG